MLLHVYYYRSLVMPKYPLELCVDFQFLLPLLQALSSMVAAMFCLRRVLQSKVGTPHLHQVLEEISRIPSSHAGHRPPGAPRGYQEEKIPSVLCLLGIAEALSRQAERLTWVLVSLDHQVKTKRSDLQTKSTGHGSQRRKNNRKWRTEEHGSCITSIYVDG